MPFLADFVLTANNDIPGTSRSLTNIHVAANTCPARMASLNRVHHFLLSWVSPSSKLHMFMSCLMLSTHLIIGLPFARVHTTASHAKHWNRGGTMHSWWEVGTYIVKSTWSPELLVLFLLHLIPTSMWGRCTMTCSTDIHQLTVPSLWYHPLLCPTIFS